VTFVEYRQAIALCLLRWDSLIWGPVVQFERRSTDKRAALGIFGSEPSGVPGGHNAAKAAGATLPWRVMLIAAIGERLRPEEERAIFTK
jgi:hypothetical protein